ncbi:MAG: cell division protein FtsL [Thiotrichaceae bacterium]|nr:cell division protein FtsL [Thiotrichaceae bacterium]
MNKWRLFLMGILYISVIMMAVQVVMNRFQARGLYSELQNLENKNDALVAQWSRLKLEEGTLLNHVVVETRARQELNMRLPSFGMIQVIIE